MAHDPFAASNRAIRVTQANTKERQVTIVNRLGLHARAASRLVSLARQFESSVALATDQREVDGKSIMSVMLLEASATQQVIVRTAGSDSSSALDAICALVERGFDEDTDHA